MKCKFCNGELNTNDTTCPVCGKPIEKRICPRCHAEQNQDSTFCNKCGWNFETGEAPHKYCPKCGSELDDDSKFCNKCGYDFGGKPKNGKKKPIVLIAIVAVLVVGCIAGGTAYFMYQKAAKEAYEAEQEAERQRQEFIASYQTKVVEVRNAIQGAKSNFDMLSTMFATSTSLNDGLLGPSFYTSYAEGLCADEITEEKGRKRDVDSLYEELDELECEEETKELKEAIEDFYYSYCERYDLLVDMNFTASNFEAKNQTSSSDFSDKEKSVNAIISQIDFNNNTETSE